ncbi:MAG: cytochrome C [Gammaproteobacteria bacterium]|nr:cytochrome C [Gammaproteobacteria bacterium]MDH5652311.1 cytochrome C [Gammaproteobacteria bacterium]
MKSSARQLMKFSLGALTLMSGLVVSQVNAETITGSAHDFSGRTYTGGQICVTCHTPHGSDTTVTEAPLWNHTLTTQTYTLYSSPSLNATVSQPGGASKLCLSCHDGSVAVDSFGGVQGPGNTEFLIGPKAVGADGLSNDHPISFTFNSALATADGGLFDPSVKTVTIGSGTKTKTGTIADVMLSAGQVQCSSCHDVHNNFTYAQTGSRLLRVTDAGSAICLVCHNK